MDELQKARARWLDEASARVRLEGVCGLVYRFLPIQMILEPGEIQVLTQRKRPAWQARVLDHLGIPYRTRPDGSLVVLKVHVEVLPKAAPARRPQLRLDA